MTPPESGGKYVQYAIRLAELQLGKRRYRIYGCNVASVGQVARKTMRFVGKAEAGKGWRIWDNKGKKWWGEAYLNYPAVLLTELNGPKRPAQLTELAKQSERKRA